MYLVRDGASRMGASRILVCFHPFEVLRKDESKRVSSGCGVHGNESKLGVYPHVHTPKPYPHVWLEVLAGRHGCSICISGETIIRVRTVVGMSASPSRNPRDPLEAAANASRKLAEEGHWYVGVRAGARVPARAAKALPHRAGSNRTTWHQESF